MNIPCSVINDLLPIYAENLASEESRALVQEHLEGCAACRERLEALQQPAERIPESTAPMKQLKKEIRRRRWRAAAIAALSVFLILFTLLVRATDKEPLDYSPELLRVEGIEPYDPAQESDLFDDVSGVSRESGQASTSEMALILNRSDKASGVVIEYYVDDETGERTAYLQYWGKRMDLAADDAGNGDRSEGFIEGDFIRDVYYPIPDRVIYGFGPKQVLIWGEPMNGGVQILPRLALAYYALIAMGMAVILALFWIIFRKKSVAGALRQLCFVPLSYLAGQLLVRGTGTLSFFLLRDLTFIFIDALAFYALISLVHKAWRQHRADMEA